MSTLDVKTLRRMIAAYGRSVQDDDPAVLVELRALRSELDAVTAAVVAHMRSHQGTTWQAIGDALGISRQAAQQRFG